MSALPAPLGMLAEVTHACPLHCPYCSNPVALTSRDTELTTEQWCRVFAEAADLGVAQVHLSGGEPLARRDLPELIVACRDRGMYTNLITSAVGLSAERLTGLAAAGLDHVQISFQDATPERSDSIAGARAWRHKVAAARAVKDAGLPLTVNVVVHRHNIGRIDALIRLAEQLRADRLELAHTQYYGWALRNVRWLAPTVEQVADADAAVSAARHRLARRFAIDYVTPDLVTGVPKPCMGGWGLRQLTVTPAGEVWPCPVAGVLPDLSPDNVRHRSLRWIWYESPAFNRFRGTGWLGEPCASCPRREIDFGGCRCQAYLLTGDASVTDPACQFSPDRPLVDALLAGEPVESPVPRPHPYAGPTTPTGHGSSAEETRPDRGAEQQARAGGRAAPDWRSPG